MCFLKVKNKTIRLALNINDQFYSSDSSSKIEETGFFSAKYSCVDFELG